MQTQFGLFCVLRFPLEGKLTPECLSDYASEHFYWSTGPGDMLTFMTLNGTQSAVEDIVKRSKTAHQFCYIAVLAQDVPVIIGAASSGSCQVFKPWSLDQLLQYKPRTREKPLEP